MAKLDLYRRKRDFEVTPEPRPGEAPADRRAALRFVVHKHHARRLHYDLRLEMEGALASWAIPKGPSYDPQEKRLAVETEDHPLEYGDFEGRIPEGEYGAGDSILWDRGTWDTEPPGEGPAQRRKGHVSAVLRGEKLRGRWHLVRTRSGGGKQQWLFFKARDETADPGRDVVGERPESVVSGRVVTRGPVAARTLRAAHPAPIELLLRVWPPQLATLARPEEARAGDRLEVKYDGFRALAGLSGGRVAIQSRNGLDLAARFPTVARDLAGVTVGEAVLDGEIVGRSAGRGSAFQSLQEGGRVLYVAFDLLWLEGEDLRVRPLTERLELLESLLAAAPGGIELAEAVPGPVGEALALARRRGWEGIVAKSPAAPYRGGRGRDWRKLKVLARQDLAIIGYTPITSGDKAIGALLLAVREGDRFVYAGKVGTGFSEALRRELLRRLEPDRVAAPPASGAPRLRGARWVRPRLVAEVSFAEWTADGMLRHPSFQRLRDDKAPEETAREAPA